MTSLLTAEEMRKANHDSGGMDYAPDTDAICVAQDLKSRRELVKWLEERFWQAGNGVWISAETWLELQESVKP